MKRRREAEKKMARKRKMGERDEEEGDIEEEMGGRGVK